MTCAAAPAACWLSRGYVREEWDGDFALAQGTGKGSVNLIVVTALFKALRATLALMAFRGGYQHLAEFLARLLGG